MPGLTVSVCTYNRSDRLPRLIEALRAQECPLPFDILVVDNNSKDATQKVLADLAAQEGVPLRYVKEIAQGIVPARNRAIEECLDRDYMLFMDDDELPWPGMVEAAVDAFVHEGAQFVGGRVVVPFEHGERPAWLGDELLGFLAEVNYGNEPFWITGRDTPVWTSNAAYNMNLFRDGLRFDPRYNRAGKHGFGGEDARMFQDLLARGARIRYRPDMAVEHFVEKWRLCRSYFLRLHYTAGQKTGYLNREKYRRSVCGVPPFMITQAAWKFLLALWVSALRRPDYVRQGMNATFAVGMIAGRFNAWQEGNLT